MMRVGILLCAVSCTTAWEWRAGEDFTANGVTFKIQAFTPDTDAAISAAYPMTLCLHSSGSLGTDNTKQLGSGEPCYVWGDWAATTGGQQEPTILVAPQLASGNWFEEPAASAVRALAAAFIDGTRTVASGLKVDADRVYCTGHSNGAGGTWKLLDDGPKIFAAASISDFFDPWDFNATKVRSLAFFFCRRAKMYHRPDA